MQDPDIEIWVLTADGQPAGHAALDRHMRGAVELSDFGLLPAFIERGSVPRSVAARRPVARP